MCTAIFMRPDFNYFLKAPPKNGCLVVCGLNWGSDGKEERNEPQPDNALCDKSLWKTLTFYDGLEKDPFRKSISELLCVFGYSLSLNSALDTALCPTNLFYNKTSGCSKSTFIRDDWMSAVKRLFDGAAKLNPSGILITGMSVRDFIWQYLSREDSTFNWQTDTQDTPELKIGMFSNIPFMLTHHYNTHKPKFAPKNLLLDNTYKPIVKNWLGAVLPDFTPADV